MTEITGRSPNKFGSFMFHLEFAAIHFKQVFFTSVQNVSQRFDSFRLSGSSGSQ